MQLRVDPTACTAHGLCAEVLPEWIELDEWGYPVIDGEPLPVQLEAHARKAATVCPVLALRLSS
jgi:ferredoxin